MSGRDVVGLPDVPDGEDERVDALRRVLRGNGVGGAAPFTIEGEIEQMGNAASGTRRTGWRRGVAWSIVVLILGTFVFSVVVTVVDIANR